MPSCVLLMCKSTPVSLCNNQQHNIILFSSRLHTELKSPPETDRHFRPCRPRPRPCPTCPSRATCLTCPATTATTTTTPASCPRRPPTAGQLWAASSKSMTRPVGSDKYLVFNQHQQSSQHAHAHKLLDCSHIHQQHSTASQDQF